MEKLHARLKAMCLFVHDGKVLASRLRDEVKNETFYRVIGGGVEFGEKAKDAVRREVMEELKCEIENLETVNVVENVFTFNGNSGHEVVFMYKGDLSNKDLYTHEKIKIVEPYAEFEAEWVSIDEVKSGKILLYPSLDYSKIL